MQQSAALRARFQRFTIFTSRASQFRSRPFSNRCGFAVYTTSKPYRFENAPLLKAYSKRHGSNDELDRRRVNERRNMRLQMKPRPCKQCPRYCKLSCTLCMHLKFLNETMYFISKGFQGFILRTFRRNYGKLREKRADK